MSLKRYNDEALAPHTDIIHQPDTKTMKGTDIELPDDVLRLIVTFADFKGLPALACACKMTRDAARDEDMLARDKTAVLRCWLALGGKEDTLRRRYREGGDWKMKEEPSDDVSEWLGVRVEGGRVSQLGWPSGMIGIPLTGTIPAEIGALDGLTYLYLGYNSICGHLPSEIGRLTSLDTLSLFNNHLEGPLPAELGALAALHHLYIDNNNFTGEISSTLANLTNVTSLALSAGTTLSRSGIAEPAAPSAASLARTFVENPSTSRGTSSSPDRTGQRTPSRPGTTALGRR